MSARYEPTQGATWYSKKDGTAIEINSVGRGSVYLLVCGLTTQCCTRTFHELFQVNPIQQDNDKPNSMLRREAAERWEAERGFKNDELIKGNKYNRVIIGLCGTPVVVDVYRVIDAFDVVNGQLSHLVKKALACGQRGHKDAVEDYEDIALSAKNAVIMVKQKAKVNK